MAVFGVCGTVAAVILSWTFDLWPLAFFVCLWTKKERLPPIDQWNERLVGVPGTEDNRFNPCSLV